MQISKWIVVVMFIAGACVSACKSDDDEGGAGTSAGGGAGGMTGGVGGATSGTGGATGGAGGAAGMMQGGMGGAAGAMGGTGGGGAGGMGGTGGAGGMGGGGAGGMGGTGGMMGGMGGMGGTGGMMGGSGGMGGMGGTGGMDAAATFTDVYSIIEMRCGGGMFGCHIEGEPGGLNMNSKMEAFDSLVGEASEECEGETRVVAGDADASLIIKALEGTACIDRMPDGRDPLPDEEIATIREWIEAGAMNN